MSTTPVSAPVGLAAAIRERLPRGSRWRVVAVSGAVEVLGGTATRGTVVAAAIDDDVHADEVLAYADRRARERGATLRAVHVWTGRGAVVGGLRVRPHGLSYADLLLSTALYDGLDPEDAAAAEREILHDRDPARALRRLSRELSLLVVAAASEQATPARPFGSTVGGLIGRTTCPLVVVPAGADRPASRWPAALPGTAR